MYKVHLIDIDKTKEWLDVLHPYLVWIMLAMYGAMFLYINRIFVKDPILRKWVMSSFEEQTGRASGKSIASFVFTKLIAFATVVAIVYAPAHLLPEYFLISLLTFVGSLYGIKVASKYFTPSDVTSSSSTTTSTQSTITEETKKDTHEVERSSLQGLKTNTEVKEEKKLNPDDIG